MQIQAQFKVTKQVDAIDVRGVKSRSVVLQVVPPEEGETATPISEVTITDVGHALWRQLLVGSVQQMTLTWAGNF